MTIPTVEDLDDELEITLRPPSAVAARAIVVAAICRRAHLELAPTDQGSDDPEGDRFDLAAWISEQGLDPALTANEQRLLKTRLGKVNDDELVAASWQIEGLAVLVWALRLVDRAPGYQEPVDPTELLSHVAAPWGATRQFRSASVLRPELEIARERERAELWHWRSETDALITDATGDDAKELRCAVREVAEEGHAAGLLSAPARNDFPVQGRPYGALETETRETLASVAAERLRALNWLCGFGRDWDHVPLDV